MKALLAIVALLVAAPAFAQTNPVPVSQPLVLSYDHDGTGNLTGFQCVLDGQRLNSPSGPTARSCNIPALSAGAHIVAVEAINSFGRSAASLTATAGGPPPAPSNLRITTVTTATFEVSPDGAVKLLATNVSIQP